MRYPGGKGGPGVSQWICSTFPLHSWYIEPFAGAANVAINKTPACRCTLIDMDEDAPGLKMTDPHVKSVDERSFEQICDDGLVWMATNAHLFTKDTLLYLDPPYPFEVRVKKSIYKFEMSSAQHDQLLRLANEMDCFVVVSSYYSRRYSNALSDWHVRTKRCTTRGGPRVEYLWTNFDPQEYRQAATLARGINFRERDRVQRKAERWKKNLLACPQWEMDYIFSQLQASYESKVAELQ